jgi:N-formylglutamate amidohydrolase
MIGESPERTAFSRLGPIGASTPLVIVVPHAGRHYPEALLQASRLPRSALETIEDRHADLLVTDAVANGAVAIVARIARAYIDLNRDEREIDPAILANPPAPGRLLRSPKMTGGLGVIPSRIAAGGTIWNQPLSAEEYESRLATAHRPYHAAIASALADAHARHGIAILLDCHSMPPLWRVPGQPPAAQIVIGDRHGKSAAQRFVVATAATIAAAGLPVARNRPYAGGHTLDRHGAPRQGYHAVQIEIDRTLYLDEAQDAPGPGVDRVRGVVAAIAAAIGSEAQGLMLAAE